MPKAGGEVLIAFDFGDSGNGLWTPSLKALCELH